MSSIVPGIVLAAGMSSRMGRAKASLPIGLSGDTFVTRIVRTLRDGGIDDVLVVTGNDEQVVSACLADMDLPPRLAVNPTPELGQCSSLQVGLSEVVRPGVGAVLVTLVDIPLIKAETVRMLLEAYLQTHAPVVRPVRNGRHGHPVIFDHSVFNELKSVPVSIGAKAVVRSHAEESVEVEVEDEGPFLDIDTLDDYQRICNQFIPKK
jgi:molybdenum cofactor cytidylyltransferase